MSTVTQTRTVVVVGRRPRNSAAEALGDIRPGGEAAVFILGLVPSPAQRRLTEDALAMANDRRFHLTAELIPAWPWLQERLRDDDEIRILTRGREARRWRLDQSLSAGGA
jgi:hypothetical protein